MSDRPLRVRFSSFPAIIAMVAMALIQGGCGSDTEHKESKVSQATTSEAKSDLRMPPSRYAAAGAAPAPQSIKAKMARSAGGCIESSPGSERTPGEDCAK